MTGFSKGVQPRFGVERPAFDADEFVITFAPKATANAQANVDAAFTKDTAPTATTSQLTAQAPASFSRPHTSTTHRKTAWTRT